MTKSADERLVQDLIPELKTEGITIDQWRSIIGNYEHCVAYGALLWPSFIEYEDCVFFDYDSGAAFMRDNYNGFMAHTKGDKSAVEAVMNHKHILDLFPNANPQPSREMILYVGRLLQEVWQAKLNRDFPDRKITVSFPEEHTDDLLQYEITFFQEHHS